MIKNLLFCTANTTDCFSSFLILFPLTVFNFLIIAIKILACDRMCAISIIFYLELMFVISWFFCTTNAAFTHTVFIQLVGAIFDFFIIAIVHEACDRMCAISIILIPELMCMLAGFFNSATDFTYIFACCRIFFKVTRLCEIISTAFNLACHAMRAVTKICVNELMLVICIPTRCRRLCRAAYYKRCEMIGIECKSLCFCIHVFDEHLITRDCISVCKLRIVRNPINFDTAVCNTRRDIKVVQRNL